MKKYKCIRKCYFLDRVFEKGERFDAPPSVGPVPRHFIEVPDAAPLPVDVNIEVNTFHQMNHVPVEKKSASDVKFEAPAPVAAHAAVTEYPYKKKK